MGDLKWVRCDWGFEPVIRLSASTGYFPGWRERGWTAGFVSLSSRAWEGYPRKGSFSFSASPRLPR